MHWIKAEIHEYILKNWRMVKVATTKAQRKLFFNLRSMKQSLKDDAADADTHRTTLTQGEVDTMARTLNVKREEVLEMETRLSGGDVALEPQTDDGEESFAPIAYLADDTHEPTRVLEARHRDWLAGDGIAQALDALDARSRRIVEERWLKVNDDSSRRHDAARPGRRVRRQRRTHPPDRSGGDEEDAQGAGRSAPEPSRRCPDKTARSRGRFLAGALRAQPAASRALRSAASASAPLP